MSSAERGEAMDSKTMLCLDSESLKRPELIGLHDEDIAAQEWLDTFARQTMLAKR